MGRRDRVLTPTLLAGGILDVRLERRTQYTITAGSYRHPPDGSNEVGTCYQRYHVGFEAISEIDAWPVLTACTSRLVARASVAPPPPAPSPSSRAKQ